MINTQSRLQHGAALVLTLVLLALLLLTGISALRAATVGLRLSSTIQSADHAFALAHRAIELALANAADDPASLPSSSDAEPLPTVRDRTGRAAGDIRYHGAGSCSAPLSGERHDYEIRVTATAARGAGSHQRQHFYFCRPSCSVAPCAETGPVKSGWQVTQPE